MIRLRKRMVVLAIGALTLTGLTGAVMAPPASAQTPSGPGVGAPYATEFPYVGPAGAVTTISYPAGSSYPALSESPQVFPYAAYSSSAISNVISSPITLVQNYVVPNLRAVAAQTNGAYCKDKSGGQVWVPAGAPPDPTLSC